MNKTLVIFLVLLLILGSGFYWWTVFTNDGVKVASSFSETDSSVQEENKPAQKEFTAYTLSSASEGKKTYSDENLSFRFPAEWVVHAYDKDRRIIHLVSPDLTWDAVGQAALEDSMDGLPHGYWLEVYQGDSSDSQTFEQGLTEVQRGQEMFGGWYRRTSIDGQDAIINTLHPHGSYIEADTYGEGAYNFRLSFPYEQVTESQALQLFEAILASVDIKER